MDGRKSLVRMAYRVVWRDSVYGRDCVSHSRCNADQAPWAKVAADCRDRRDFKGKLSICLYGGAAPLWFAVPWAWLAVYILIAIMCFIPDPRVEKRVKH